MRRPAQRPVESVKRYALTRKEAAASIGMSVDTFERRVQPFLKVIPCGQLLLVPPDELRQVDPRERPSPRRAAAPRASLSAPAMTDQLLTVDQLAERWQVKESHVYRLAREGRIPTVELGRYRRWRLDAIEQWEQSSASPPEPERPA